MFSSTNAVTVHLFSKLNIRGGRRMRKSRIMLESHQLSPANPPVDAQLARCQKSPRYTHCSGVMGSFAPIDFENSFTLLPTYMYQPDMYGRPNVWI